MTVTPALDHVDTVLVPLDGSEFAERAIPVALRLAERFDAGVQLFSAVPSEDDVADRLRLLEKLDVPLANVANTVVTSRDVAGAIHTELRRLGTAVACMASHGRGRSAALIGSVATEVVARGHDPLVLSGPEVDSRHMGASVVACTDETPESRALVGVALRWSAWLQKRAIAITVGEPVPPPLTAGPPRRRFGPNEDLDLYLSWLVAPYRAKGAEIETRPVYDPISPADGVRSYVRDHPACLVVVGSRAHTGLRRAIFGSTAAAIVHCGHTPVLLVPRGLLDEARTARRRG
jgi:nucleotide-binding universal stress UspA family protein